jgi:hypothetical protein
MQFSIRGGMLDSQTGLGQLPVAPTFPLGEKPSLTAKRMSTSAVIRAATAKGTLAPFAVVTPAGVNDYR